MVHAGSLRWRQPDSRRFALAIALSLLVHLLGWGGYELGRALDLWHRPAWLRVAKKNPPPAPPTPADVPLVFVDVNEPSVEAPKETKYYSDKNSRAANPDAAHDANLPQINGRQTDMLKTEDVNSRQFSKLQPAPAQPQQQPQETSPARQLSPGDLTMGKPEETPQKNEQEMERPRTIKQALAQLQNQRPSIATKQDGGVLRRALSSSLDAKATEFGEYDRAFIDAVQQHWYDLLDSQRFALDRTGKVTLQFKLSYDGKISDMEVLDNSVGNVLGYVCQKAVMDPAPYEKWPSDMRHKIGADFREITFTFYYY